MFKKYASVSLGLMLAVSSVGCCMSRGYSAGYPMGGGCSPCNNGCSPAGAGYVPQGAQLYQGDMSQTAFAPAGYTQSAYVPQQTAAAPAVIQVGSGRVGAGLVGSGRVGSGVWSGRFCSGLVWCGLVWSGLVWAGLVWFVCLSPNKEDPENKRQRVREHKLHCKLWF